MSEPEDPRDSTIPGATAPPTRDRTGPTWRRIVSVVLLVLACVAAPLAITSVFVRDQLLDTDQWVDTMAPLASNPVIQERVAVRTTDYLTENVDIGGQVAAILPDVVPERFSAAIATAIEGAITSIIERLTQSQAFETVWREANRIGHATVEAALTGGGPRGVVTTENGQIAVNLQPLAQQAIDRLSERGLTFFENVDLSQSDRPLQYVVADVEQLEKAQDAVDLLQTLAWVLVAIAVVGAVASIALSTNRRRTVWWLGLGFMIGSVVLGLVLLVGRWLLLDNLPADASTEAAGIVFDTVLRYLRTANRALFVLGAVLAVGGWLAGGTRSAQAVRGFVGRPVAAAGGATAQVTGFGAFGGFVSRHTAAFRIAGLIGAALLLLVPDRVTPGSIAWIVILLLLYLALVEIVARAGRSRAVEAPAAPA